MNVDELSDLIESCKMFLPPNYSLEDYANKSVLLFERTFPSSTAKERKVFFTLLKLEGVRYNQRKEIEVFDTLTG